MLLMVCACGDDAGTRVLGESCETGATCQSGACADGICCDSPCTGSCVACVEALTRTTTGTCAPIPAGTDPDAECETEDPATCGTSGLCDGVGACALFSADTLCASSSCSGAVESRPALCDGAGTCAEQGTAACAPYECNGTVCANHCAADVVCGTGSFCNIPTGNCEPLLAQGGTCQRDSQCVTGSCVDNVCCDSACAGECRACAQAATGLANGTCGNVVIGTDPFAECADQGAASCGRTGACGVGACALYPASTVCTAASCSANVQSNVDSCNGTGTCIDGGTTPCAPYTCGATSCQITCTLDTECLGTTWCNPSNTCVTKLGTGQSCTKDAACVSGSCVDGFCCDSPCGQPCLACSAAKTGNPNGACAPIVADTDPDGDCVMDPASTCGKNGSCNGGGACALYDPGTICNGASCSANVETYADTCNGAGTCADRGTGSCSMAQNVVATGCAGDECSATCLSDFLDCNGINADGCECPTQATTGCCSNGACPRQHINGLGQVYYYCGSLGVPGNQFTYNLTMADLAGAAWPASFGGGSISCGIGPTAAIGVHRSSGSSCATWTYTGPTAGRVRVSSGGPCQCPTTSDPTWN